MRGRLSSDGRRTLRALCLFAVALFLTYFLTKFINIGYGPFLPRVQMDNWIPFVPPFILIYFGSYLYWIVGIVLVGRQGKESIYGLLAMAFVTYAVCFLFFVFMPTTIIRPEIGAGYGWNALMRLLYRLDTPQNLFPSMHCLNSWLIFIAVRGKQVYPKWIQWVFGLFSLLVFASTVFVKQHYLADIAGGVVLGELGKLIVTRGHLDIKLGRVLDRTIMRGL